MVNALSSKMQVWVYKEGETYTQSYKVGVPDGPVGPTGEKTKKHGTLVRFWPDNSMFTTTVFDYDTIKIRLRQQAYLTKGITITLVNEFEDTNYRFFFEGGIQSYVHYLNRSSDPVADEVFYVDKQLENIQVEVALQYKRDDYNEKMISFVNNVITPEGGTHVVGFKMALTRTINKYAREQEILKEKDQNLANEDVVEGLTVIISIKVPEPQFE